MKNNNKKISIHPGPRIRDLCRLNPPFPEPVESAVTSDLTSDRRVCHGSFDHRKRKPVKIKHNESEKESGTYRVGLYRLCLFFGDRGVVNRTESTKSLRRTPTVVVLDPGLNQTRGTPFTEVVGTRVPGETVFLSHRG